MTAKERFFGTDHFTVDSAIAVAEAPEPLDQRQQTSGGPFRSFPT